VSIWRKRVACDFVATDEARRAFARLLHDSRSRTFYRHPYAEQFIEAGDSNRWLMRLVEQVDNAAYTPGPAPTLETAKANFHVRPGVLLSLEDQFVYHLLAMRAAEVIGPTIAWSSATVRFSYRLADQGSSDWFRPRFHGWRNFTKVSLGKLRAGASHVLIADIAGFYENIDIGRLVQELRATGVPDDVHTLLSKLWNKWCGVRRRGIPQGFSPSDLFAEFYMDQVDKALGAQNLDHLRYSDDIRIFAPSERAGHLALHKLERTLRDRGLNPQTAKTKVLPVREARDLFARVDRVLGRLSKQMGTEFAFVRAEGGYLDPAELRRYLTFDASAPRPEVVNRAWELFLEGAFGGFDSTLLHYLLARLGEQGSAVAQDYCLGLLEERPEETDHVMTYFSRVADALAEGTRDRLVQLIIDEDVLLYPHQRYLLLRWFFEERVCGDHLLAAARRNAFTSERSIMRPHWIAYLGTFTSDEGDFTRLERELQDETDSILRATYLYAVRRAPAADRDLLYGRCLGESLIGDGAIKMARQRG
jgi:hypothetical protein